MSGHFFFSNPVESLEYLEIFERVLFTSTYSPYLRDREYADVKAEGVGEPRLVPR